MEYLEIALQNCIDFSNEILTLKEEIQNRPKDHLKIKRGNDDVSDNSVFDKNVEKSQTENFLKDEIGLAFRLSYFAKDFITSLHQSVISGEYYFISIKDKFKEFQIPLSNIEKTCIQIDQLLPDEEHYSNIIQKFNIHLEIRSALHIYSRLARDVQSSLNSSIHQHTFYFDESISKILKQEKIEKIINRINEGKKESDEGGPDFKISFGLFQINVALAEFDDKFQCEPDYLRALIEIKHYFDDQLPDVIESFEIADVLVSKCQYLIKKVFVRLEKHLISDDGWFNFRMISREQLDTLKYYIPFNELTIERYDNLRTYEKDGECYKRYFNQFVDDKIRTFKIFHFLSKYYYKNCENHDDALAKSSNLIKEGDKVYLDNRQNLLGNFNKKAIDSLRLLLRKNKLKIHCYKISKIIDQSPDISKILLAIEEAKTEFIAIKKLENETNLHDFYHYRLMAEMYLLVIKFYFRQKVNLMDWYSEFDDLSSELENCIQKYNANLDWAYNTNFTPLYLPFEECKVIVKPKDTEMNIFLDSSYLLPINLFKQRAERDQIVREFEAIKFKFTRQVNLKYYEYIKDKVLSEAHTISEDQTYKGVQVLGIFAAMISLVVAGIGVLPKINDVWLITIFMIGFVLSLAILVYLLHFIVNRAQLHNRRIAPWLVGALGIYLCLLIVQIKGFIPKSEVVSPNTNTPIEPGVKPDSSIISIKLQVNSDSIIPKLNNKIDTLSASKLTGSKNKSQ